MNVNVKKNVCGGIITMVLSGVLFAIIYQIWNIDLNIPSFLTYGDGMSTLTELRNFLDGGWLYQYSSMAAPYGCEAPNYATDGLLNFAILKILVMLTGETGLSLNLFYMLTYPLTAICAYWVLRRLHFSIGMAIVGGTLYSWLPYHYLRTMHLNLFVYFTIPICCLGILRLLKEETKSLTEDIVVAIACVITGIESLYFGAFTMLLFCFVAVWNLLLKRYRYMGKAILFCFFTAAGCAVIYVIPLLLGGGKVGGSLAEVQRSARDLNEYGIRLWALLMPVLGHRISALGELTKHYYDTFAISWDAYTQPLGALMSIGLIGSICSAFGSKRGIGKLCGQLNIFIILLAITDGFDILVAVFISSGIRCYNRMSVFIAFFALVWFFTWCQDTMMKRVKGKKYVYASVLIGILFLGVWDQTPAWISEYVHVDEQVPHDLTVTYEEQEEAYRETEKFYAALENTMKDTKIVFTFPLYMGEEHYEGYRFTKDVKWNCNRKNQSIDRSYSEWLEQLEKQPVEEQLKQVKAAGCEGVLLLKEAYTESEWEKWQQLIGNDKVIIDQDGTKMFWKF